MNGKIIRIISNLYTVKLKDKNIDCKLKGKFRNDKLTPLVGDLVKVDIKNNIIIEVLDRKNILVRPNIVNVDNSLIITSVKKPDLSLYLLDKLIINSLSYNITPIICFTKLDLLNFFEKIKINRIKKYYESIGYKVFYNTEISKLKKELYNKEIVLTGQTGAGKSSLINKMFNLNIKTDEISHALGRGKHTTRHTELYIYDNIYISDTPGFSSLELNVDVKDLKKYFVEFNNVICPFKDCSHTKEKECNVKKDKNILKSRYINYLEFYKEVSK